MDACAALDDGCLVAVLGGCPALERLHLTQCEMITDRAVFYIGMQCTSLIELNLRACDQIDDDASLQALHDAASPIRWLEAPSGKKYKRIFAGGPLVEDVDSQGHGRAASFAAFPAS